MRGDRAARSGYGAHLTAVEVHEAGVAKSAVHGVAEEEEEIFSTEMFCGAVNMYECVGNVKYLNTRTSWRHWVARCLFNVLP